MAYCRLRSSSAYSLIAIFLFIIISPAPCDAETTQDTIKKICSHTYVQEEYVFCCRTFNKHLRSPDTDILGLTRITIERSLRNATNTHNLVLGLIKNATGGLKDALVQCNRSYKSLIKSFQLASLFVSRADYQKVIDAESPGPLAQDKCAWSLSKAAGSGSMDPLVESNREMRILVSMSLVTTNYLVNP